MKSVSLLYWQRHQKQRWFYLQRYSSWRGSHTNSMISNEHVVNYLKQWEVAWEVVLGPYIHINISTIMYLVRKSTAHDLENPRLNDATACFLICTTGWHNLNIVFCMFQSAQLDKNMLHNLFQTVHDLMIWRSFKVFRDLPSVHRSFAISSLCCSQASQTWCSNK